MSIYEQGLAPTEVNHVPLTPLSFIERTASVYPDYPAVIHGDIRRTWRETYRRCRSLASALAGRGIGKGDTVAVMLPNIPAMLEAHFGVPMIGAVLNTLNVRLDADAIAYMLEHGEARALIVDREFHAVIGDALARLDTPPLVIDVDDPEYGEGEPVSDLDYEAFLAEGDPAFDWHWPDDEWNAISLNYTSGTTGDPKGVVYQYRQGTNLQSAIEQCGPPTLFYTFSYPDLRLMELYKFMPLKPGQTPDSLYIVSRTSRVYTRLPKRCSMVL